MDYRVRTFSRVDFAPTSRQPAALRLALATIGSIIASLATNAALVKFGTAAFSSTRGYSHFRFFDYATLTVLGVIVASGAWPIVIRITSAPSWLFFRLAIIVTSALWLPDLWLLVKHEPGRAVAVLATMHLAVALITYNFLVHAAPPRPTNDDVSLWPTPGARPTDRRLTPRSALGSRAISGRAVWIAMMVGVSAEFAAGLAALLFVPFARRNGWLPSQSRPLYLVHAILGVALFGAAVSLVAVAWRAGRLPRIGAQTGFIGILIGAGGGLLAVDHAWRLLGMALMFLGGVVGFFGYFVVILETPSSEPSAPASAEQRRHFES